MLNWTGGIKAGFENTTSLIPLKMENVRINHGYNLAIYPVYLNSL